MTQMIPAGPVVGFIAMLGLLATLDHGVGLGRAGWLVGAGVGAAVTLLIRRGLVSRALLVLGPADRVTLTRAVLVCGVAALVADGAGTIAAQSRSTVLLLVALSSVALLLDAVDGRVARRTGTVSPFGARFDLEVDAFLILVLSVQVARDFGWWVLLLGSWRYALLAGATWASWLRGQLPARRWRKVVAAVQGVVLTVATAHVLADAVVAAALVAALILLTASFGTEIGALQRLRQPESRRAGEPRALGTLGGPIAAGAEADR